MPCQGRHQSFARTNKMSRPNSSIVTALGPRAHASSSRHTSPGAARHVDPEIWIAACAKEHGSWIAATVQNRQRLRHADHQCGEAKTIIGHSFMCISSQLYEHSRRASSDFMCKMHCDFIGLRDYIAEAMIALGSAAYLSSELYFSTTRIQARDSMLHDIMQGVDHCGA